VIVTAVSELLNDQTAYNKMISAENSYGDGFSGKAYRKAGQG